MAASAASSAASAAPAAAAAAASPDDERLVALRAELAAQGLSAFVVPSADPHQSEYVADAFKRRAFVCRFDGSAGTAVVAPSEAAVWTDARYWAQAEQQLGAGWQLKRQGREGVESCGAWLAARLAPGATVGFDPWVTTPHDVRRLVAELSPRGVLVRAAARNPVDAVWGAARPAQPANAVFALDAARYAGETAAAKLARVRAAIKKKGASALLVSALDETAWLLNLRGSDIAYNPVFAAYTLVEADACTLFLRSPARLEDAARASLAEAGVAVRDYEDVLDAVGLAAAGLWIDSSRCSVALCDRANSAATALAAKQAAAAAATAAAANGKGDATPAPPLAPVEGASPVAMLKAVKNGTELRGMRQCHLRDAAALTRFLAWLEREVAAGSPLDEVSCADRLEALRAEQADYMGLSFETISASGPNAAVIHYAPVRGKGRAVGAGEMYLVDSGGQYRDGTTDITRTVHLGRPTAHERRCFTLVLRGHVALAGAVFPQGTPGPKLDVLARAPLWRDGLDYGHGTGHGVGAFLNVHEGPHGISATLARGSVATTALQPGMTVTNEPGYYEDGAFGIRIESVMVVREAETPHHWAGRRFFRFETIALVPLQRKLIDLDMLLPEEEAWIDSFHTECREKVSPLLAGDPEALAWLERSTRPLRKAGQ